MKRTALKRKRTVSRHVQVALRLAFHDAARQQEACVVCGATGPAIGHHLIYQQRLRAEGKPEWDPRGAVRICDEHVNNCHPRHHHPAVDDTRIALAALSDEHVAYAFEVLGVAAAAYLRRRYFGDDPRLESHLARLQS